MAVKKIYYSMGEVAEMFDVRPSLIRHWESQFACLKPHKNQKGNRMFTEADIEKLKQIYHLVKERGMTLKGAAQVMRRSSQDELARQTQLLERLQRIRAALIEVREELKTGDGEQVVEESGDDDVEVAVAAEAPVKKPAKRVAKPKTEPEPETLEVVAEPAEEDEVAEEQPKRRAPRRKKKSDDETKELFPFYEQSLF
ncbi:MAG: MerR family transcriptional regulator [Alistipes sp.]|nr:MerR family transcriptional regulator [Alistipes sp.]